MAAGTAFAISYNVSDPFFRNVSIMTSDPDVPQSDIADVTPENLVVFTVLQQYVRTPFTFLKIYILPVLPGNEWLLIRSQISLHAHPAAVYVL